MAKTLYIIDGHAHIYSAYYAPIRGDLTAPDGRATKATYIFTNAMLSVIEKYRPDMLVVAMDSKSPTFRSKIYPEYKAHRPPMPEDMPGQIADIEKILKAMNIPMLRLNGYEADDIIGTLAKKAVASNDEVFICSKDKDMLQLINDNVKMLDIKTGNITDVEKLMADKNITPGQFIDVLALMGDSADNIPGLPDVGPKTALQWIAKYGSIDNLYRHADEIKGKRGQSLRDNKDKLYLSKKLVVIDCQSPVEFDYESFMLREPDKNAIAEIFTELGFNRLLKNFSAVSSIPSSTQTNLKEDNTAGEPGLFDNVNDTETASQLSNITNTQHDYILVDTREKLTKLVKELSKQEIFAFDTETTSISAMKAELVAISICWQKGKAYYLPVKAPLGCKCLSLDEIKESLSEIFADGNIKKIGQNLKYDLLVMKNAGFVVRGIYFDTMVASYCLSPDRNSHSMDNMAVDYLSYEPVAISELIGKGKKQRTFDSVPTDLACDYACEDADITFQLYDYLLPRLTRDKILKKLFDEVEMPLVEVLTELEYNGVSINTSILKKMAVEISDKLEILEQNIYNLAGEIFNIDSPKQLAVILFEKLGLKPLKKGKTGPSTNASVLEQLKDRHEIIPYLLQYRELSKLRNTYVDKLPKLVNRKTNRLHASFNQTVTVTGRLSSSEPNLQNIPIRTALGREIRSAFVPAEKDFVILSADYSQIELRLLAHFSGDAALSKAFNEDTDIHRFVASEVYGVDLEDVDSDMRSSAKAVNFGIIYGQGPHGLSKTTGMSYGQAKKFIDDYFSKYSSIKKFMDEIIRQAEITGYAQTILGRKRPIKGLISKNFNTRSQAHRFVINTTIQGSAADLIKVAMINIQNRISQQKMPVKMILQIHDELVFELPKKQVDTASEMIKDEMENAIKLNVPLKVDMAVGKSWLTEK